MAKFAGSIVDFTPASLQAAGSGGGYSAAADAVSLGANFQAQREKAPKFDALAQQGIVNRSQEKQAAMKAEADVLSTGLSAIGQTKGAALQAEGAIAAAKAEAEAQKSSSMMGAIGSIASAGLGLLSSDERTKTDIQPIETALETLRGLKPVTFRYKDEYGDPSRLHHGFIAQEYKQVLPDATYFDIDKDRYCIDPIDVIGLLVRANQELEYRITRMEAERALETV